MKTPYQHVIADADFLSNIAKAEVAPGCRQSSHIPRILCGPITVVGDAQDEMMRSKSSQPVREFGNQLPGGFVTDDPRSVDPTLIAHFKLAQDKEKGDVHSIALAEERAQDGGRVLVLTDEKKIAEIVRQRAAKLQMDISTQNTPEFLCESAKQGCIKDLKAEWKAFEANGIRQFNDAQKERMNAMHDHVQSQEQARKRNNEHSH